jgi:stage III sporulation protein AF
VSGMDQIYDWVKNIVIYVILNTIIMNLLGNNSYKKYVSIVSGMILVIIVVSPLMKLLELDENLDYNFMADNFSVETSDFKNELSQIDEQQKAAVFKDYEDKLKNQVKDMLLEEGISLTSFQLTFDQDVSNSTYGEILGMDITGTVKKEDGKDKLPPVEEIEIDRIDINGDKKNKAEDLPSPLEINIKNKLSDFYNIEQDNINISIQGG